MPAIKATNSNNLTVENCDFIGFDTDIELENVDGFISKNNKFSQENDPRALLIKLSQEINNSGLDKSSKERLGKEIIEALSSRSILQKKQDKIKNALKYVGSKATDFFIQLSTAVIAGLIIKSK